MNSIVYTHVALPVEGTFRHDVALDRLGAWLDAELGALEDLLVLAASAPGAADIAALRGLHLGATSTPADTRQLLEDARASLGRLLECVQKIPFDGPLSGRAPSDFDAWVRWSGARLQDMIATLDDALAA